MKLPAIKAVLAQYKHTETGVITQEMIQAAWAELAEAEAKFVELEDELFDKEYEENLRDDDD